jgi:hypothetical protein
MVGPLVKFAEVKRTERGKGNEEAGGKSGGGPNEHLCLAEDWAGRLDSNTMTAMAGGEVATRPPHQIP